MGNREWGMGNREWGIGNREWGIGNGESLKVGIFNEFPPQEGNFHTDRSYISCHALKDSPF